jgi:outer membrane protein, multidrug efflux system
VHTAQGLDDKHLCATNRMTRVLHLYVFTLFTLLALGCPIVGAQEFSKDVPAFEPPPVSDPMLSPPPRAAGQVKSWEEALALIRSHSPDYRGSAESTARAEAQKRIALAAVLPTLTGLASYTHNFFTSQVSLGGATFVSPPTDIFSLGAVANWSIFNPRGLYGISTADKSIDATKLAFEDRRREIAALVLAAFLATLADERVAELNRVGLRTALERLVLTQTRLHFGKGTPLDVDRAEQDVASARATLISGDEALRQAHETLGQLLGSRTPLSAPGKLDLAGLEQAVARTCHLNRDLEQRPDVATARLRVELAERQVRDAELQLAPTVNVTSQAGYATAVTLGPKGTLLVQGVLTIPFYDGGARYGALRDAKAATEQARQTLEAARINAIVSSARAERAVTVLESSRDVLREQRDLAVRVDQRTRNGYVQGLGTSLDLVTSAQALRQSEISLALLDFQVAQARASAYLVNAECTY